MKNFHWSNLTSRHTNEQQCLASFIAWQAAEVISKTKPANLINILDKTLPCNRNIYNLWNKHRSKVLELSELQAVELRKKGGRLLSLIYNPGILENVIHQKTIKKTLWDIGYRYDNLDEAIVHLNRRMGGNEFPHEIGFFLGYPIKDVLGFMGLNKLPLVANGPWKIYGDLETSLSTLKIHEAGRKHILDCLKSEMRPLKLLQKKRPAFQQAA